MSRHGLRLGAASLPVLAVFPGFQRRIPSGLRVGAEE